MFYDFSAAQVLKFNSFLSKNSDKNYDKLGKLDKNEIEEFIDRIVCWYKVRFPDTCFVLKNNYVEIADEYKRDGNCVNMTFEEFNSRISDVVIESLKCLYIESMVDRSLFDKYNEDMSRFNFSNVVVLLYTLKREFLKVKYDKKCFLIAEPINGKVLDICGDNLLARQILLNKQQYNLNDILKLIKNNYSNRLIISSLEDCINRQNNDILIRKKLIYEVCRRLIFDDSSEFQYGYYRADVFVNEFKKFYKIDLPKDLLKIICDEHINIVNSKKKVKKKK